MTEPYDAVVVGGGHSGLASSWHLASRGIEHLVLEAGRVGESWRSSRWDSFAINTPGWSLRLPGDEIGPGPRDGFPLCAAWIEYLDSYVRRHSLPIRTGAQVTSLGRSPSADGFLIRTADHEVPLKARSVIIASGFQRVGTVPAIAAGLPPGVLSMPASQYRSASGLPAGGVLIVGSAQSGGQIAEDLLDAGRTVLMSASAVPRCPRRYRGRDIFEWLDVSGFLDVRPDQLPDRRLLRARQPSLSGVGRYGHTISLQSLAGQGVQLLGRLVSIDGDVIHLAPDLPDSIRFADRVSAELQQMIDRAIERLGISVPEAEPDPADIPVVDADAFRGPETLDLAAAGIGTVIWATGFGPDLAYVDLPIQGPDGALDHVAGRSVVPGLWFLGMPWMRSRKSGVILGADEDARAIVAEVSAWLG